MDRTAYHKDIEDYYRETEHAYRDSWNLDKSLAIHYGYTDDEARSFARSLERMNEVMAAEAGIQATDHVLDAGCGVGGSSIFLASRFGCRVTGITLSGDQAGKARKNAAARGQAERIRFAVQDYCRTDFAPGSFDVVWGCESICYADDKAAFIREAWRLLKPGGRLVVADGFISRPGNNEHPVIRQWLDGWLVNYLETPERFSNFMQDTGFTDIHYRDITPHTLPSAKRLYRIYFLASLYLAWRKISFSKPPTAKQVMNIRACKWQYKGLQKGLWQYGIIKGMKP